MEKKFHYSHTPVSAAFQLSERFSCLLRDKYKKVSDATVCINCKSFEKHLGDPVPAAETDDMKLVAFCLFAVFCWSLSTVATNRTDQTKKLEEVLRQLNVVKQSLQVGSSTVFRISPMYGYHSLVITINHHALCFCLAAQQEDAEYATQQY